MRLSEFNTMMLLTDGFGGFGGISQFNRDFLTALDHSVVVTRTFALPRVIKSPIEEEVPESVVYLRTAARGMSAYLSQLARTLHLCGNIDLIVCGHLHLLPLAYFAAKVKQTRLALVIHGIEAWQPTPHRIANKIAPYVDAVIAVSRLSAERFQQWSGVPAERAFILGNCVDLDRFVPMPRDRTLAARYGLLNHPVIMTLGRLSQTERYKGIDEVIGVLPSLIRKIPNLRYFIVGDGDDRTRLETKVNSLGLAQHVVFARGVPESDKVAHYNLADAFVMPSSGEGFGIVLLEAAACGLPVIGSAIDGSREALLGGAFGQLVDPRNSESLEHTILSALNANQRHRPKGLEAYSIQALQAKVDDWLSAQVMQPRSLVA